jgi:hypothetical protein
MLISAMNKKLIIYMPNRKVFKEYQELFPATELSKNFDINYIFGEIIFNKDAKFEQILFPQFIRTFHALLHFSLIWYRKFTTLSYRLRAFQYFGTSSEIKDTSNFFSYNGKRHSILIRFTIYFFGNYMGTKGLHNILKLLFFIWQIRFRKIISSDTHCVILPYGGGISLEFDFIVWICRRNGVKTIAIQENWDNLSSKSILLEHPTRFLTWGNQSSSHLRSFQRYKGVIHEIGSLRINCFYEYRDKYLNVFKPELKSYSKNFTVLLIGTGPGNHDLNLINCVLECFKDNNLSEFQLIYRPHPFSQLSSLDLDEIRKIHSVKIDLPHQTETNDHRLNLIISSNAVVSLYSTVLLEASIVNKLCIIPSFIVKDSGYHTSNFLDDSPHYSGISVLGNIYCADTENDFLKILKVQGEKSEEPVNNKLLDWFCKDLNSAQEIINEISNLHENNGKL